MATTDTDALAAALAKLLPKRLDEVITRHRDHAELRLATDADLAPLRANVPVECGAQDISDWSLVTFDWHRPIEPPLVATILFGYHDEKGHGYHTSPIVKLDRATQCVRTRSGTLYRMTGPASKEPDLLRICAWLHLSGVGTYLGAMHIFY